MVKAEETALVERNIDSSVSNVEMTGYDIKSMIYVVRNQQVMIDNDLAMLYQVETRTLNQAVKRNITRFPERFRFQLTKDEYKNLKSQIVMSGSDEESNGYVEALVARTFWKKNITICFYRTRNSYAIVRFEK